MAEFTLEAINEIVRAIMADTESHGRDHHLKAVAQGRDNDVLAMVRHNDGGPPRPVIFDIEPTGPHRIAGINKAGLRTREQGD